MLEYFVMYKALNFFSFFLFSISAFSQTIYNGNYIDGKSVLKFSGDRVYFDFAEMGNISHSIGEGTYEIMSDYMVVSTGEYPGEKTNMQALDASKKDTIVIKVTDVNNHPLSGALVEALNAKGKLMLSGTTGNDGRILFLSDEKISQFRVFNMGSTGLTFDYIPKKDFWVKMSDRLIVENQLAAFKIAQINEETISALLLSTDFDPGKDQLKALEKLDARAQKRNFLPIRIKKEYVPYVRETK